MSTRPDSLDQPSDPDRVFYELGVMLDKEDFRAEQTYHRGRLARALAFLHGTGTVAGLEVKVPPPAGGGAPDPATEEVQVEAGLAIDRIGRMIEVPSMRCVRLAKWLAAEEDADEEDPDDVIRRDRLRQAFHPDDPDADPADPRPGNLIIDVFLRFAACDRGKTPAFATGPFDALDAVQPSRIRDGFEIVLAPRGEADPPVPTDYWSPLGSVTKPQREAKLRELIFGAWERFVPRPPNDPFANDPVVPDWLDPRNDHHWLFLARLRIPCLDGGIDKPAERDATEPVVVANEARQLVVTPAALAQLLL